MSGPKRNPDKLNTIGVVVVGICGAVMVYVTITALEAFYMNDTSEIQTMADYGGQDQTARSHRASEMTNITEAATNGAAPGTPQTYRIPIDHAMELVAGEAKDHPDHLVPGLDRSADDRITQTKATVKPIFGRGETLDTPAPAPAPAPTDGAGSGAGTGSGSAAPAVTPAAPNGQPADKKTEKKDDKAATPPPGGRTDGPHTAPAVPKTDAKAPAAPKTDAKAPAPKADAKSPAAPKADAKAPAPKADAKAPAPATPAGGHAP